MSVTKCPLMLLARRQELPSPVRVAARLPACHAKRLKLIGFDRRLRRAVAD